jgi:hypothetical protein
MSSHLASRLRRTLCALALASIASAAPLSAAIVEPTSLSPTGRRSDGPYMIGYDFTVGASNITLNTLGAEDITNSGAAGYGDGTFAASQVGIWNAAGTLLGSVNIKANTGSPIINGFRYERLASPITLLAGQTYTIGAQKGGGVDYFSDGGSTANYAASLGASGLVARFNGSVTFAKPVSAGGLDGGRWSGGNATLVDTSYAPSTYPLLSWAGSGTTLSQRNDFAGTVGYQVTTGANPVAIKSLGFFDYNRDGLAAAHRVGVWDATTGQLVAQATVPSGTAGDLKEFTRYVDLGTAVNLLPNHAYYVGAEVTVGGDIWYNNVAAMPFEPSSIAWLDGMTIDRGVYTSSAFGLPNLFDGASQYFFAPNLQLVETPEPASWVIVLVMGAAAGVFARCRRTT